MDNHHSSAFDSVCGGLRSLFEPVAAEPMPDGLSRLMDALEEAAARGELELPDGDVELI